MENKSDKYFLTEGESVAHKENLTLKMEVRRIIKKKKVARDESEVTRIFTLGIECGWWANQTEYRKEIFHTSTLVPWEVAEGGFTEVIKYIDEKNKIKER